MAQDNQDRLEKLLRYAGKQLNTSPEALKTAFEQEGLEGLARRTQGLSPQTLEQVQTLMADRTKMEEWMNSPQVQALLSQLLGEEK